jgi:hypothetical protein
MFEIILPQAETPLADSSRLTVSTLSEFIIPSKTEGTRSRADSWQVLDNYSS